MSKYFLLALLALVVLIGGVRYFSLGQSPEVTVVPPTSTTTVQEPAPVEELPPGMYRDAAFGFSLTLPTSLASTTNPTLYAVDGSYSYTAMGPGKEITGVKFTIPSTMASGTNLSDDTYISVEHLAVDKVCEAAAFLGKTPVKTQVMSDGGIEYLTASSSDAAAGNRYEEYIYAASSTNPCIAVRYFIHYGAIENYPKGAVKQFDRVALLSEFDDIRHTLTLPE